MQRYNHPKTLKMHTDIRTFCQFYVNITRRIGHLGYVGLYQLDI